MLAALGIFAHQSSVAVAEEGYRIEEIVVRAQRREETLQTVPIAVSAFDADAIDRYQIDSFSDLQFNVPNVSYSKTNFTGNNFQIRGIGNTLIAASSDSGTAMHVNDVYLNTPRIFEMEYYDLEQVEILRGPQGTLFGRNATGGVVNLQTKRPIVGEFGGGIEAEAGNYDHRKIKGSINLPIGDRIAARIAGVYLDRDGYSKDVNDGGDVDDREQWSLRGSIRWEISDNTTLDVIGHYFEEDSSRTRSQKQLCDAGPNPILGCLPTTLEFEPSNPLANAGFLLSSNLLLGELALFNVFAPTDANLTSPDDFRKVRNAFPPEYKSDETFVMFELQHDLTDVLQLNVLGSYQDTSSQSRQDFFGYSADETGVAIPPAFCFVSPAACSYFGLTPGGPVFVDTGIDPVNSIGAIAGGDEFVLDGRGGAEELSGSRSEQWSAEVRLASSFDGPVNFLLAGYYLEFENEADYDIKAPTLNYPAVALANAAPPLIGNPAVFGSFAPGKLYSSTRPYELESLGIFGELYWEASETVKVTVGLRYTKDDKFVRDRQAFLSTFAVTDVASGVTTVGGRPVSTIDELLTAGAELNVPGLTGAVFDADPNVPGNQAWRELDASFDEMTGRIVVDWSPDLEATDNTLFYFSYSRGYKSGGVNPPFDVSLFPDTAAEFDPEDINAFELGTKNTFWDNRVQANFSAFYYDYGGLQIGKIVNRTSLNENTDAEIFGFEGEFIVAPNANWLFNAQISYLHTELKDTETVDPRDPTQGRQDVSVFKDFADGSNCALSHNGLPPPSLNPLFVGTITSLPNVPYIPTGQDLGGGLEIPPTPGISDSAISACAAIAAIGPLFGYTYEGSGIGVNLNGNELQGSPDWTVSLGAQYTWYMDSGMSLTARADYYWQDAFFVSSFNRPQDRVASWDVINLQATLNGRDDKWFVRAFVQNIEDDDNIVGAYVTDPAAGLFTNVFLNEPRLYGLTLGVNM
jgi:outer membrane receptor protein involved in Fe transport